MDTRIIDIIKSKVNEYNRLAELEKKEPNKTRQKNMEEMYLEILMSNPCGFELTARMTTNYRQLKTIYYQRRQHKLPDWREFCAWIETLPMFKELCLGSE